MRARRYVVPGAPTNISGHWLSPGNPGDSLATSWAAGATGNSPIDSYEVTATAYDSDTSRGPYSQTVTGTSAYFQIDDTVNWAVSGPRPQRGRVGTVVGGSRHPCRQLS